MPLIWKILGYGGNGLLALFGLAGLASGEAFWFGVSVMALAGVNLYLVRKIDLFSREEAWLETELRKRELRRQIEAFDRRYDDSRHGADSGGGDSGTSVAPKRIEDRTGGDPSRG